MTVKSPAYIGGSINLNMMGGGADHNLLTGQTGCAVHINRLVKKHLATAAFKDPARFLVMNFQQHLILFDFGVQCC